MGIYMNIFLKDSLSESEALAKGKVGKGIKYRD